LLNQHTAYSDWVVTYITDNTLHCFLPILSEISVICEEEEVNMEKMQKYTLFNVFIVTFCKR